MEALKEVTIEKVRGKSDVEVAIDVLSGKLKRYIALHYWAYGFNEYL